MSSPENDKKPMMNAQLSADATSSDDELTESKQTEPKKIRPPKHKKETGHSLKNLKTARTTKSLLPQEASKPTIDVTTGTNEQVECQASFQKPTEESATTSFTHEASTDDQSVREDDLEQLEDDNKRKKGSRRILKPKFLKLPKWGKSSQTGDKKTKTRKKMTEVTGSSDKVGQIEDEGVYNLQEKYNALKKINQQLLNENIHMNKRINALSNEKAQLIEMTNANARVIQQLQDENVKKNNENQQHVDDNRKKDNDIRQLNQEKHLIEEEKQQLQEEKSSMESQIQQIREESIRMKNEIQQHVDDNCKKDNDIRLLHLEKDVIAKEKQQLQEEKSSMESQMEKQIQQLRQEKYDTEHKNLQLREANRKNDNEIRNLSNEKQQLQEQTDTLRNELHSLQKTECGLITERGTVTVSTDDKLLGRGGWAAVYTGDFYGTKVAVKEYYEVILSPHNRQKLEREINIASQCRHPNLLQMICATKNEKNCLLIVTELMDMALRTLVEHQAKEKSRLEPSQIKSISLDVARGLNYLHLKKPDPIIHRDVSSANVLLWIHNGSVGRAKISDYGSANFMQVCKTANPGAALYAAPEAGGAKQSPKIDVFSYGLLICEMCICELPEQVRRRHQIEEITNTTVRGLVEACTRKDPKTRPAMKDLIEFWKRI